MVTISRAVERSLSSRLHALHVEHRTERYEPSETVFAQGDGCAGIRFVQKGRVKLTVTSRTGLDAVVGVLGVGAFFGEGALAGQRRRRITARAITGSTIGVVATAEMRRRLREEPELADLFRAHLLTRNSQIEGDLVDPLVSRSEQRLARWLLRLAGFDEHQATRHPLPVISRKLLAEMIGKPRSTVNVLMNRFRKLGFLERHRGRDGGLQVHCSMLSVVLDDWPTTTRIGKGVFVWPLVVQHDRQQ
jgi:CRP/FNR family transcriptional regulator, cyclic AMP receptor protein